jgi:replicative DNA helicase
MGVARDAQFLAAADGAAGAAAGAPGILTGAQFVLDAPIAQTAIWGSGQEVLWAKGESLYLTGPLGVGKSTLQQQLLRARLGLQDEVLGWPVVDDGRPVLLIAADRPAQIQRSMRRLFTEKDRATLESRLRVHKGVPPFDIVKRPEALAEFAGDAGTLAIDSLKDLANPLTSDEVGAAVNRALQIVIEAGCEVVSSHHHRKATSENKKPSKLGDVYGSVWLTAGAGSVITLWGEPGDPVVDLLHLKAPAEEVGPLELEHDHERGETWRRDRLDVWTLLQRAGKDGIDVRSAATTIYGKANPSRAEVEKVRRKLDRLVQEDHATCIEGANEKDAHTYVASAENDSLKQRDASVKPSRELHDLHEPPPHLVTDDHAGRELHARSIDRAGREGRSTGYEQEAAAS